MNEDNEPLTDMKHDILNGTTISNFFYLENKYTKPTNFHIETFIDV